ncbi:hypoxanthine phosphoribosyltransferase [Flavobacterium agricola]|uniref:Hypoxanthine phosphoribosyltransferase n=1 Tax=Flavobacterium agricola TaxID=2870839 RepID=A0ABY6LYZ2_9FLAO|nr:hypoxanthine phosphoribosyltransferase [Flavobacterium agricola]UYW01552.1 hypoxanthine phosphoribosyltransferase [Flavobacterium agricola]
MEITIHDKTFVPFIDRYQLDKAVANMVAQIQRDYVGRTPLFIGVLNGSILVMADILKKYQGNCEVSFVKLSSYQGTQSTETVKKLIGLQTEIYNRDVIVVEDIVDTGNTVETIEQLLKTHQPKSVKYATLFLKPEAYHGAIPIDYVGIEIENKFIVGYGLDYDELGRNLPDVYQLK